MAVCSRTLVAAPAGVAVMGGWPGASSVGRGTDFLGAIPALFALSFQPWLRFTALGLTQKLKVTVLSPSLGESQLTAVGQS